MSSSDTATLAPSRADELRQQVENLMEQMDRTSALIEALVAEGAGECLPDEPMQRLFRALVDLYAQKFDAGERSLPCGEVRNMGATKIMVTASGLLKGANLELFELGMWQSFSGTR
jgi:hypothetical protein